MCFERSGELDTALYKTYLYEWVTITTLVVPLIFCVNNYEKNVYSSRKHSTCVFCICRQCIEKMGVGCFTPEQVSELVSILTKTLTEHFEKQAVRQGE